MLAVQTIIGSAEGDRRNGRSQRRYQGNMAGAQKRVAAIGQANASGQDPDDVALSQAAVPNPTSSVKPVSHCEGAKCPSTANTGPLKRKVCTYVSSEPIGMRPLFKNGTYMSPHTPAPNTASRMRIRFQ